MEQVIDFCVMLKRIFHFVRNAENTVYVKSHYKTSALRGYLSASSSVSFCRHLVARKGADAVPQVTVISSLCWTTSLEDCVCRIISFHGARLPVNTSW
jgi:hypothetical protein